MTSDLERQTRVDTALTALASRERRRLLYDLWTEDQLSMHESATVAANGSGRDLDDLRTELHHVHLPKLVSAGYVDHDEATGIVTTGPNFSEIEPLLRLMSAHADELPDGWL
ncbi:DUF7344 domain-containing protein [Halorarius litoreus]|uniref:DUF7344 domain-containing protein n=1 Tax=Halorarius litoreus TaxID=2962676 RepID=UPI0020CF58FA|nr:hypothetical protein [Halorarius litoreus]